MIKYVVSFGEESFTYSEEQLRNFIEVAIIKNKDIANFSVRRIKTEN